MKPTTRAEFLQLLKKSRLLTTAQRVDAKERCHTAPDAAAAAADLVAGKFLTSWQAAQLLQGRTRFHVGKYKLVKFRGRGAMGVVFKAEHPELQRTVAVKVLSRSLLDRPHSVARFLREIRSTALLNHPNLVVAYDADQVGDSYCLVMEYVSGRSLKALSQEYGLLPVRWTCECVRQAALALTHIHERGLVHRDVKPSNLLVSSLPPDNRPRVKLLDIGLARFVSETEEDGGLTRDGQIVGTGDYMAPEQVAKARQADIRADIYGLGATLFQLVTGTAPLAGDNLLRTYMNRLQSEPPLLSTLREGVPPGLDSVLAKMLQRDPANRYQTPAALAADLAAVLSGFPPESAEGVGGPAWTDTLSESVPDSFFALPDMARVPEGAFLGRGLDSVPEFPVAGLGSTAEGGGSTDGCDSSVNDFLGLVNAGDEAPLTSILRRKTSARQPVVLRTITVPASRLFRLLLRTLGSSPRTSDSASDTVPNREPKKAVRSPSADNRTR